MSVTRGQRWTQQHPCPICGGWDRMMRGHGLRCWGFLGTDGDYAHCVREELAGGLELEKGGTFAHRLVGECRCGTVHGDAPVAAPRPSNGRPEVIAEIAYDYEGGLRVLRRELAGGSKTFVQQHRNGSGTWEYGRGDAPLTLYRAPELRAAPRGSFVFLVEGEKKADLLRDLGLVAVTTPGGASSWGLTAARAAELLAGWDVVILPDRDQPGARYAADARATLAPVARSLRIVDLPGLAEHGDVVDWLKAGHEPEDLVKLAEAAPDLLPPPPIVPVRVVDLVDEILAEARLPFIPTGLEGLDFALGGGLRARMLHVVVAGSGKGKTSLAVQIAALHSEHGPALYYSGELTRGQLAARLIGQRTHASWREVLRGGVARDLMVETLAPLELDVLRACPDPIGSIGRAVDEMIARGHGVPLVVIDYAQLLADIGPDMRLATMTAVRLLKAMVENRNVVILLLSQGSRPSARAMAKGGGSPEDYIDAAAESSDIEKAASTVIVLTYANGGSGEQEVTAQIAKQRLGGPGRVGLVFDGPSGRWSDLGRLPAPTVDRATEELIARLLQLVTAQPTRLTRTALAQKSGVRQEVAVKQIDRLVDQGLLVMRPARLPNRSGRMQNTQTVDLPGPTPQGELL